MSQEAIETVKTANRCTSTFADYPGLVDPHFTPAEAAHLLMNCRPSKVLLLANALGINRYTTEAKYMEEVLKQCQTYFQRIKSGDTTGMPADADKEWMITNVMWLEKYMLDM